MPVQRMLNGAPGPQSGRQAAVLEIDRGFGSTTLDGFASSFRELDIPPAIRACRRWVVNSDGGDRVALVREELQCPGHM